MAEEENLFPGVGGELTVKSAAELKITAPSGKYVAVLDSRLDDANRNTSTSQAHHNGYLNLVTDQVDGNLFKVKGKIYIPGTMENPPQAIWVTIWKPANEGGPMFFFVRKSLKLDQIFDEWVDFEIELSLDQMVPPQGDSAHTPKESSNFIMSLSAVPLAGPLYLDNLHVTDLKGNELWEFPEFEMQ